MEIDLFIGALLDYLLKKIEKYLADNFINKAQD